MSPLSHGELRQMEEAAKNRAKTGVETPEDLLGIETRTEAQKGRSEAQRGVGEDHGTGPIHLDIENITQKLTDDIDAEIMKAVINCNIKVNKPQLIRALELDNKVRNGELVEVTRCRDCEYWDETSPMSTTDPTFCRCRLRRETDATTAEDFCSYGRRKEKADG